MTKTLRMVGFDDKTQAKLAAANTAQSTVHLSNCEITKSSYLDGDLEVTVRKTTNIEPSPKKKLNFRSLSMRHRKKLILQKLVDLKLELW